MPHPLTGPVAAFAARLKYPTLFKVTLALMILSWLFPDPLLFVDEIVTALAALLLANWRKRGEAPPSAGKGRVIDGEARRDQ